jgi:hypothetical protein
LYDIVVIAGRSSRQPTDFIAEKSGTLRFL